MIYGFVVQLRSLLQCGSFFQLCNQISLLNSVWGTFLFVPFYEWNFEADTDIDIWMICLKNNNSNILAFIHFLTHKHKFPLFFCIVWKSISTLSHSETCLSCAIYHSEHQICIKQVSRFCYRSLISQRHERRQMDPWMLDKVHSDLYSSHSLQHD